MNGNKVVYHEANDTKTSYIIDKMQFIVCPLYSSFGGSKQ